MTRLRVLIADDNPLFAESVASMLAEDGRFDVVARAANGQEAVALTELLDPQLVLMDVEMPVMDGLEATRRIALRASAPVIVLTSSDSTAHLVGARKAGAAGYLRKDLLEWSDLLARALAVGRSDAA
jgi:DNA-binding NarL/FixJ family response regulator